MNERADFKSLIEKAAVILIIQADNPDGDSLGSALALEHVLGDLGKEPYLYCGVNMPDHIKYLPGWDRVNTELPKNFDLTIMVDNSSSKLVETLLKDVNFKRLSLKPFIIIDHHDVKSDMQVANIVINEPAVATAEVVYDLSRENKWGINEHAASALAAAILSDSLGLSSAGTTSRSIRTLADLVDLGANLSKIEQNRRSLTGKTPDLLGYKGRLLQRVEYFDDGKIAVITIPWEEIAKYSQAYNPPMLVIDDMRQVIGVKIVIGFKIYKDGKITVKIRCNPGTEIAGRLAEEFGGGGHAYASGFKITDGSEFIDIKKATIEKASKLLRSQNENL